MEFCTNFSTFRYPKKKETTQKLDEKVMEKIKKENFTAKLTSEKNGNSFIFKSCVENFLEML